MSSDGTSVELPANHGWLPGAGPVALVGSGEFLPQMEEVDRFLLTGRPSRAAFLPTAAGQEGAQSFRHWLDLGHAHFEKMGIEPVPVPVMNATDANDPAMAERLLGVGLIYLSGGNPGYLAATLRGSLVWERIVSLWRAGTALAGCSAGAGALSAIAPDVRGRRFNEPGLGLVPHLVVIPHYDKMAGWDPGFADRMNTQLAPGMDLVGIDEDTALVGGPDRWMVMGRQAVHRLSGRAGVFPAGSAVSFDR